MAFFVTGVFLLGLGLVFAWWLTETSPKNIKLVFAFGLTILFLMLAAILLFSGKFIISIPALIGAFITYQRYRMIKRMWEQMRGGAGGNGSAARTQSNLTRAEAAEVLGVSENANKNEIKAAHKSLMKKFHPDQGGNSYQAKEINEAKEVLLE